MKELEFSQFIPWRWKINDRMEVSQNHIYLARSVKQKILDQVSRLFQPRDALREGSED